MRFNSSSRSRVRGRTALRTGFTLIEVLLVLVILSVIAGLVVVNIGGQTNSANKRFTKTQIANLATKVNMYQLNVGSLPTALNDLYEQPSNLSDPTKWDRVIDKPVGNDPWDRPYEYKIVGSEFEIRSLGPDGQANTEDDITNKD